ncbi:DUF2164 domain-containing protein [Candidatus Woesearchaeota archaeon]|nr:DUF2164 domain-containing protein [Candidatus Woesearchaeota archaeon]
MGKIGLLSQEQRKLMISEIISFFKDERNEEIGIIAAEAILDFFVNLIGPTIYNSGIRDSLNLIRSRFGDIEADIDSLLKN